jgi:hypothetical protein
MAQALRDATAQPSSPQHAGLYCISQADGGELWVAWDGTRVLASATTYHGDDLGPIVERLGKLVYGDDVEDWIKPPLNLSRSSADAASLPATVSQSHTLPLPAHAVSVTRLELIR